MVELGKISCDRGVQAVRSQSRVLLQSGHSDRSYAIHYLTQYYNC